MRRIFGGKSIKDVRRFDYVDVEERGYKGRFLSMPSKPHVDCCLLYLLWIIHDQGYEFLNEAVTDNTRKTYDGTFL